MARLARFLEDLNSWFISQLMYISSKPLGLSWREAVCRPEKVREYMKGPVVTSVPWEWIARDYGSNGCRHRRLNIPVASAPCEVV
jgi:hypothetical protein